MTSKPYRHQNHADDFGKRTVVPRSDGYVIYCPCGQRQLKIYSPPHDITFDMQDQMTVSKSIKFKYYDGAFCHFTVRGGIPELYKDSQCDGRDD